MRRMPSAAAMGSRSSGSATRSLSARRARREIEPHLAAEKAVGAEPAEQEIGVGDRRLGAAEAVAHRPRRRRRRSAGRRAARRRCATRAIEPPPVPTSWMSTIGDLQRQAAGIAADHRAAGHQHLAAVDHAGLRGGAAHVEGDRVGDARSLSHSALVPITPAAGPDSSMRTQARCASSRSNNPPVDCTIRKSPLEAGLREMLAASRRDSAAPAGRHRRWPPTVEVRSNSRYSRDSSCDAVTNRPGWRPSAIALTRCSCAGLR